MPAERLPLLTYRQERVDFEALYKEGRTPSYFPLPEGGFVAIVPDQPLKTDTRIHWQRDPKNLSEIVFTDPNGKLVTTATAYLLSFGPTIIH